MAKVQLTNGGTIAAKVTNDQHLLVTTAGYPAFEPQKVRPFRSFFTNSAGSNDMGIDGSVTNVEFSIDADTDDDRYITNLSVLLGYGTTAQPFQWADGTALTNGILFRYESGFEFYDIHEGIKNNQDMFRLSHQRIDSGWELRGVGANNDYGYIVNIDLEQYVPPYGIKLDAGTDQRLVFTIRDNVGTAADTFNVIAYGFDRFK